MRVNIVTNVARSRLAVFSDHQIEKGGKEITPIESAWPEIGGCLAALFVPRSGSTFLCRELEGAFQIGQMGEVLNPAKLRNRSAQQIVAARRDSWFAFKAGVPGVVAAESCGFFDAYIRQTSFIRLVRKDIVAQAVSLAKGSQTQQWKAYNSPTRAPVYDRDMIAHGVTNIARGVETLGRFAEASGRPSLILAYEDFSSGDLSPALAAGDALGVPRREADAEAVYRPVERMGDAVNEEWRARFLEEMDSSTRDRIERYLETTRQ